MVRRRIGRKPRRRRLEVQPGRPRGAVQPAIVQRHVRGAIHLARGDTPARAALAANLEQIGEIIVEQQRQIETRRPVAVVAHADPLIRGSAPQEDRAHDVQHVLLQHDPVAPIDVGIGEVDRQRRIVVAQIGAEQQRLHLVQHQFEPGEIAGVGIEQAVGPAGGRADIAVAVEHDEGIVVLERTPRPRRRPGHRDVERRFLDRFGLTNLRYLGHGFDCH